MHRAGWIRRSLAAGAVALTMAVVAPLLAAAPAGAAGITTHAWMATTAIDKVTVPELRALLAAHVDQVYAGAQFPDSGYVPGNTFGEEAHWQRFFDQYARIIASKPDCGPLTDPNGPCAAEIAHLMGAMAHGMGDEVWDWLFEPMAPDLDEYYLPTDLTGIASEGGLEFQMDLAAIALYGRTNPKAPPIPSKPDVIAALAAAGLPNIPESQLDWGQTIQAIIHSAEASLAVTHIAALRVASPYLTANLITDPGGIEFAATAIAGEWENMWGRLLGDQPATKVSITYPADGDRRIPAGGWVRSYGPGSYRDRGGARTRITAALTYSLPYVPGTGGPAVPSQLPAGSMTVRQVGASSDLPILPGYPRLVPYGPDAGEHVIDVQPATDLTPCAWYEVRVTSAVKDNNGRAIVPTSWRFRAGARADGGRCPDDPYTPDEKWTIAAHRDLFGTTPTAEQIEASAYRLARDLDRVPASDELVDSAEHRGHLVDGLYRRLLLRRPTSAERTAAVARLATTDLRSLRADLLGSDEYLRRWGLRSDESFVQAVAVEAFGKPLDKRTASAHANRLALRQVTRTALAAELLGSPDGIRASIRTTWQQLLGTSPTSAQVAAWVGPVGAADERVLERSILAGSAYDARAQRG